MAGVAGTPLGALGTDLGIDGVTARGTSIGRVVIGTLGADLGGVGITALGTMTGAEDLGITGGADLGTAGVAALGADGATMEPGVDLGDDGTSMERGVDRGEDGTTTDLGVVVGDDGTTTEGLSSRRTGCDGVTVGCVVEGADLPSGLILLGPCMARFG